MSWRDRLVTASFRSLEFLTDSHDAKGGRRLVVHEYPGAEEPGAEDMGGKAWDWHLNAYFIGPDYDLEVAAFLQALNTPGAAYLMHPWMGELWVRAHNWSRHESNDKGGFCTLSIDFVPGGVTRPAPTVDAVDTAGASLNTLGTASTSIFDLLPMSSTGMTAFVAAVSKQWDRVRDVIAFTSLPLTYASQLITLVDGMKGDLHVLFGTPARYASAMGSFSDTMGFMDLGSADHAAGGRVTPRAVSRCCSLASASLQTATNPVATLRSVGVSALAADSYTLRVNMIAEASFRARMLVVSAGQLALTDYSSSTDRDAALNSVLALLDAILPTSTDAIFEAVLNVRTDLINALSAQDLEPASSRKIVSALPATVLAHRLEIDEAVFIARNAVRHPLFVQGKIDG